MKKTVSAILCGILCTVFLTACGGGNTASENKTESTPDTGTVTIYAAKSMTDCMDELIAQYKKAHEGVDISVNYASSGDLQSQIENGAPCDLFLSAAQKQMDALCEEGLMANDSRDDLLTNEAVLITPADNTEITSFDDLAADTAAVVAIGDPASVPAGQYAQSILTTLGIWDTVKDKAVLGSDVRQVLAWVETGEADAGIVYATDAAITDSVKTVCAAPKDSCAPVIYPIVLTVDGVKNQAAVDFLAFLQSEESAEVFASYGFGTGA